MIDAGRVKRKSIVKESIVKESIVKESMVKERMVKENIVKENIVNASIVKKSIVALLIICSIISACMAPAFSLSEDGIEIKMAAGSDTMEVNGVGVKIETPYIKGGLLYIPLRAVTEAFGGEVNWLGGGNINIIYRDLSVDISLGTVECAVNREKKYLESPPEISHNTTMVPVQFFKNIFSSYISCDCRGKYATLILEDDGALGDLSFLVGSISKPKAGDSYFGWSMNIPAGSRVANMAFNSRYVLIENIQRAISIEVSVEADKYGGIDKYYEALSINPSEYINGDIAEYAAKKGAGSSYIEAIYNNQYDEASIKRIFFKKGLIYSLTLTLYNESNPYALKKNKYYCDMLDSFSLRCEARDKNLQDLSKVKYGLTKYENYIETDSGKKYFSWELCVPPEWDRLPGYGPFEAVLGKDRKEYISVEIIAPGDVSDAEEYAGETVAFYRDNFNPRFYSFKEKNVLELAGFKTCSISFDMRLGNDLYAYDEYFILSGGLLYDIVVKYPLGIRENSRKKYFKMLNTLKIYGSEAEDLRRDIEKQKYNQERSRVGKDDSLTEYRNKTYGWSVKLPGYWIKSSQSESSLQTFSNKSSGALIGVEVVENADSSANAADNEKFVLMNSSESGNMKLVEKKTSFLGKSSARMYVYRLENEDEQLFAYYTYYVAVGSKYSYCFMSAIPVVCSSEKNLKEMENIINSFMLEAEQN